MWKKVPERKKIAVIAPSRNPEPFIRAHIEGLKDTFDILFMCEGFLPGVIFKNGKEYRIGGTWFRALTKLIEKIFGRGREFSRRISLKRELRKEKVDVVLAEYGFVGKHVASVCRESEVPLVVHFHGYDAYSKKMENAYQELFQVATQVIAVSHEMKDELIERGAPKERILVNVYGVDGNRFPYHDPSKVPPHAIFWGRLVRKKAPYLTLLAFGKALEQVPNAELTLIGNGPLWEDVKILSEAMNLSDKIHFIPAVLHHELPSYIKMARVYVQHSLTTSNGDSEGTPNSILEAGVSGLPVVSTRHAGIKDVVVEGWSGLLVDEKDVNGMAEHLVELFLNPNKAKEMGVNSRNRILNEHSSERSLGQLKDVLLKSSSKYKRGSQLFFLSG